MHRAKGTPTKECGWKHDGQSHNEKKDVRERTLDMPSHGRRQGAENSKKNRIRILIGEGR
jgi:hypothetical protein